MQLLTLLFLVLSKVHLQFSSSIRDGLEMTTLCFTMSRSENGICVSRRILLVNSGVAFMVS
uniref:Uncharacterized protein n=1 Tax=Physcomitrium patens TaxID=3218 RepID=A0A2K1KEH5_PHYPA|nr:hypothetical protein PHYPA_008555 [Physcomitrium patens]